MHCSNQVQQLKPISFVKGVGSGRVCALKPALLQVEIEWRGSGGRRGRHHSMEASVSGSGARSAVEDDEGKAAISMKMRREGREEVASLDPRRDCWAVATMRRQRKESLSRRVGLK